MSRPRSTFEIYLYLYLYQQELTNYSYKDNVEREENKTQMGTHCNILLTRSSKAGITNLQC